MHNRIRGEAELIVGARSYRLLLTLGALAEIETGLGLNDLSALKARAQTLKASDLATVVAALLRGGGEEVTPDEVLRLPCDLGVLLTAVRATFAAAGLSGEGEANGPFVGTPALPPVSD